MKGSLKQCKYTFQNNSMGQQLPSHDDVIGSIPQIPQLGLILWSEHFKTNFRQKKLRKTVTKLKMSEEGQPPYKSSSVYNELRLEGQFCDAIIKVEDVEFPVHRIILCNCTPYFRWVAYLIMWRTVDWFIPVKNVIHGLSWWNSANKKEQVES